MEINLVSISKKYNKQYIFKNLTYSFKQNNLYAIKGHNGSGKSTLLQVIAGKIKATEGTLNYLVKNRPIKEEDIFKYISFSSPYLNLLDDFTLNEMIDFHFKFKRYYSGLSKKSFLEIANFLSKDNKPIKYFSSGMKQRLKNSLAILSETPVLLLDEPLSNLDKKGILWYKNLLTHYSKNRIVIICSNDDLNEIDQCNHILSIDAFKPIIVH